MKKQLISAWSLVAFLCVACATGSEFSSNAPPIIPEPDPKFFLPTFEHSKLPNGIAVYLNRDPAIPYVSIAVGIAGGRLTESIDKAGLTELMARVMTERTRDLPKMKLAGAFDDLGAIDYQITDAGVLFEASVLADRIQPMIRLFAEVVTRPLFVDKDIDIAREKQFAALWQYHTDPHAIAQRVFQEVLFGRDHILGIVTPGTPQSLKAIGRQDLWDCHARLIRPENISIAVAGPIDTGQIQSLMSESWGAWSPSAARPADIAPQWQFQAPKDNPERDTVYLVAREGMPQTVVRIGAVGFPRAHKEALFMEFHAVNVAGRAGDYLRTLDGITYGVRAIYEDSLHTAHFSVETSVVASGTRQAIDSILSMYDSPPRSSLVYTGIQFVTHENQPDFTLWGRTRKLASNVSMGLPPDYIRVYNERWLAEIERSSVVTAIDAMASKRMQIVLVGDPQIVVPQIESMSFTKIKRVD